MQEYIRTLIYLSVFSIVLEVILPETKLKKYISSMIALLVIFVAISPVIKVVKQEDIVSTLSETYQNINLETSNEWCESNGNNNEQIKNIVKRKMEKDILDRYNNTGILVNKVEVELTDEYKVIEVNIYVSDINNVTDAKSVMSRVMKDYELKDSRINVIKGE